MMTGANGKIAMFVLAAALSAGCADSGGLNLSTSSISTDSSTVAAKTDPVCVSLANQINTLKSDGTIERLEKASDGKTSKVEVKRTALQKQAELNKANADFVSRCGPPLPKQMTTTAQQQAQPAPGTAPKSEGAAQD